MMKFVGLNKVYLQRILTVLKNERGSLFRYAVYAYIAGLLILPIIAPILNFLIPIGTDVRYVLFSTSHLLGALTAMFTSVLFSVVSRASTIAELEKGVKPEKNSFEWHVLINGIHAGVLSNTEYKRIKRDAENDLRNYLSVVFITIRTIWRFGRASLFFLPVLALWGIFIWASLEATSLHTFFHSLSSATPENISSLAATMQLLLIIVIAVYAGCSTLAGNYWGWYNPFEQACNEAIRRRVGSAVKGEIYLYRIDLTAQSAKPSKP